MGRMVERMFTSVEDIEECSQMEFNKVDDRLKISRRKLSIPNGDSSGAK